jgi:hypothetical protein
MDVEKRGPQAAARMVNNDRRQVGIGISITCTCWLFHCWHPGWCQCSTRSEIGDSKGASRLVPVFLGTIRSLESESADGGEKGWKRDVWFVIVISTNPGLFVSLLL